MSTDPFDIAVLLVLVLIPMGLAVLSGGLEEKAARRSESPRSGGRP